MFALLLLLFVSPSVHAAEIALVQYDADRHFGDYDQNRAALTGHAEAAVARGAKIVVFPEGSHYGYAASGAFWCAPERRERGCHDVSAVAEAVPGGRTSLYWEAFARRHGVYVLFSIPEASGGRYYNSVVAFGPEGLVGLYRKRALYVTDKYYASPGDLGAFVLRTPYGNFGLLICMDGNYAQFYEEYKALRVDRILLPMDWDEDPHGRNGARPARVFFQRVAGEMVVDIYVADVSPWDGTGFYPRSGKARERNGLGFTAIGEDGVSYHKL